MPGAGDRSRKESKPPAERNAAHAIRAHAIHVPAMLALATPRAAVAHATPGVDANASRRSQMLE
jgi:hypothetical protein